MTPKRNLPHSFWLAALALCAPQLDSALAAEGPAPDTRKSYIRCAAVFGVASTRATEQRAKDGLSSASMLLALWASELDRSVPPKEAIDAATKDFAAEIQRIGADLKKSGQSDAARREFDQSFSRENDSCREVFKEAATKNKPVKK